MSYLEITTAIAYFALVLSLFGFFIGSIYNSKQIEKLNKRIDREVREVNRQLGLLNNSVYGNLENNCRGSIERRLAQLELNEEKTSLNIANLQVDARNCKGAINKLAKYINYSKSNIV